MFRRHMCTEKSSTLLNSAVASRGSYITNCAVLIRVEMATMEGSHATGHALLMKIHVRRGMSRHNGKYSNCHYKLWYVLASSVRKWLKRLKFL
jgi:hypothetical protein